MGRTLAQGPLETDRARRGDGLGGRACVRGEGAGWGRACRAAGRWRRYVGVGGAGGDGRGGGASTVAA
jgi:hypothetical protein